MGIDKYFQKGEHKFFSVLTPQRSEISIGRESLKMVFNEKSPFASCQVQGSSINCLYTMEIGKSYVSSTVAGSGLLSQLGFPYISTPLAPKL